MKKLLLFSLVIFVFALFGTSQTLYSNSVNGGNLYNPGLNNLGNPKIVFDDVNVPSAQVAGSDSVAVTKVKFGIYRFASAPAVTVKFYYSPVNPAATTFNNLMRVPPVLIGTSVLPVNGATPGNVIVNIGDSVMPIFKVKTDTGFVYTGQQTLFLGVSFSAAGTNNGTSWRFATPSAGQSFNDDVMWIYDADSTVKTYASYFGGTPPATFHLQAFGFPVGGALPVTISEFKGERRSVMNTLSWTTLTEQNNAGFELERSADGLAFSSLGLVSSRAPGGNSTSVINYTFDDVKPFAGNGYYRLKQVDRDGKSSYSKVVLIHGIKATTLILSSVYPNPASRVLNLVLAAPAQDQIQLVVSDLSGKIVLQQKAGIVAGTNNISVNLSRLAKGSYVIKAIPRDGSEPINASFIKQ